MGVVDLKTVSTKHEYQVVIRVNIIEWCDRSRRTLPLHRLRKLLAIVAVVAVSASIPSWPLPTSVVDDDVFPSTAKLAVEGVVFLC